MFSARRRVANGAMRIEIVVRRCWPSMIRNLDTPTGTLRAGIVTTAPMKCVALSLVSSTG